MKRVLAVTLCAGLAMAASIADAQSVLERLERAIRQKSDAQPAADGQSGDAPAARRTARRAAGDDVPPVAYLGAVIDDRGDRGRGARVISVNNGGPAANAGLKPGDLVVAVDGLRVRQTRDLLDILQAYRPGRTATFDVQRDRQTQRIDVTLGGKPAEVVPSPAPQMTGNGNQTSEGAAPEALAIPEPPSEAVPSPIASSAPALLPAPGATAVQGPSLGTAASSTALSAGAAPRATNPASDTGATARDNDATLIADLKSEIQTLRERVEKLEAEVQRLKAGQK